MPCYGILCCKMPKRNDYKVSSVQEIELEPLGGDKAEPKKNGVNNRYGTGDSNSGRPPREGVATCSQKRATCLTAMVLGGLLAIALVIAYAGPQNDCSCAGKMPPGYIPDYYNSSQPFQPIATNGQNYPWLHPYLPNNVRPLRYQLTIHPNLTTLDVKGQVTIDIFVEKETHFIVLHIQDLNVTEKILQLQTILGPKGYTLKIVKTLEYPQWQQMFIEFKEKLRKKGNYTLSLRWYSRLSSEAEGFYVDQYVDVQRKKRMLAATVFEPGGARRAFPCFDEPHLRAPFRISVFRDRFHLGLSNSLVQSTDDVGFYMGIGLLRDDFFETPPLPPDALTWVVSDFERQTLQPSHTYQATNTAPSNLLTFTRKSNSSTTDSLKNQPNKNGDSQIRPNRNITAASITRGLIHPFNHSAESGSDKLDAPKSGDISSEAASSTGLKPAPYYTFYSTPNTLQNYDFVLNTSRDVLEYLQTWLGIIYPLEKLDFVSLPSLERDISSSLGIITIRTKFLRPQHAITTREYHCSGVIIAEGILRQFFGGITSPRVWKYIWMWEGIVRYLSRMVLVPLKPSWPMDELNLVETMNRAMDIDAIQGWESILNGTTEDGKNERFYVEKSAALFSMLSTSIGVDNFRGCLGNFLSSHTFQISEPLELWTMCTKYINNTKNIKEMMNIWTQQPGFPLVEVTKNETDVFLSQSPFEPEEFLAIEDDPSILNISTLTSTTTSTTHAPPSIKSKTTKLKWIFPITYITNDPNISGIHWMTSAEDKIVLPADVKWLKINSNQNGYYRVLYDNSNWNSLIDEIKADHKKFHVLDRIGLISDAFTLCHANLLSCEKALEMIKYLPKEANWGPMATALRHLERWRRILKYSDSFLLLTEYVRMTLKKSVSQLGWNDTGSDPTRMLRAEVLLASVLWAEPDAIEKSKKIMHLAEINQTYIIEPNLREVYYTGAVLSGELIYWQYCMDRFKKLQSTKEDLLERMELLRAMGKTKDAWLQNRLLSEVLQLPTIEVVQVLEAIAGTPTGGAMACRFLQAKWLIFQSKLGKGSIDFARVISAITQYGATKFDYDELKSLVERFGDGPGMTILNMTLRSVATNVEWVTRSRSAILEWMDGYSKG